MSASAWPRKSGVKIIFADLESELPIGEEKLADSQPELPIGEEKLADSQPELPIGEKNLLIWGWSRINIKIAKMIKLSTTSFEKLLNKKLYSEKINSNLKSIY